MLLLQCSPLSFIRALNLKQTLTMLNNFLSEAVVHIRGRSAAIAHDFELHHVVFFFMFGEYRDKKRSVKDKSFKDKSWCWKKKDA